MRKEDTHRVSECSIELCSGFRNADLPCDENEISVCKTLNYWPSGIKVTRKHAELGRGRIFMVIIMEAFSTGKWGKEPNVIRRSVRKWLLTPPVTKTVNQRRHNEN